MYEARPSWFVWLIYTLKLIMLQSEVVHIFYKSIELSCHSATCFVILPCCSIYDASACAVVIRSKSLSFKLIRLWNKQKKLFFERVIFNLYPHKCLFIVREYHNPESLYTLSVNHVDLWNFCLQTPKKRDCWR